jgi:hypothetical protein
VQRTLHSLKDYGSARVNEEFHLATDHLRIASLLKQAPCSPFTIIIEEELLDPSHFWDKRYVKISTEQTASELDEIVLRHFVEGDVGSEAT